MTAAVKIFRFFLNILYGIFKIFRVHEKRVLFCSRQSSSLTTDFRMIQEKLKEKDPEVETVTICCRFQGKKDGIFRFARALVKSMYYMATSRVCVLDGYWPAACMLKHRDGFRVVQIWHSVGKIKKSGYQTLDSEYGRSGKMAKLLDMHRNYDYIITGSEIWNPFYCASFNVSEDVLRSYGLPRLDDLIEKADYYREKVLDAYPEMRGKHIVLYAPTFRKNEELVWKDMAERFAEDDSFAFICRFHPNQIGDSSMEGIYNCPEFDSMQLLAACDSLITDYSSMALEGAALNKEIYYYIYDYDDYRSKNGLNLDIEKMMPEYTFRSGELLFEKLRSGGYDREKLEEYRKKYLPSELGRSTEKIVDLILSDM